MKKILFQISGLLMVVLNFGCDKDRIAVPVCACIVNGTAWTVNKDPQELEFLVNKIIYDANDNVWIPGADIAMLPKIDHDGHIKVINDPDLSAGMMGDIEATPAGGELVAGKCRDAWGTDLQTGGLVIVIAHRLINNDGSHTNIAGYSEPYAAVLDRNSRGELCSFPRSNLAKADVLNRYIILEDPMVTLKPPGIDQGKGTPYVFLAHEFGHVLMLGHGDGLDNDANGTLPPLEGTRLFDEYCDNPEYLKYDLQGDTRSLMSFVSGYNKNVTVLQKEVARAVAPLLPGAIGH